jgi:hypothetical protein
MFADFRISIEVGAVAGVDQRILLPLEIDFVIL